MMLELFNKFPREVAKPYRIQVNNLTDFLDFINKNNGRVRIFTSLYDINPIESLISLNKLWFDFDSNNSLNNVIKLHNWCMSKNLKHIAFFSGGGFHFYILTKNYENLSSPQQTLYNCHRVIADENNLTIGEPDKADIDFHTIGDIRRIVTIPNTYNLKRRKYCIPLIEEDLEKGIEHIKEKANKQHFEYTYYGKELFDVKPYDRVIEHYSFPSPIISNIQVRIDGEEFFNKLPPCIRVWLSGDYVIWKRRGWIIWFLRDKGIWRKEIGKAMPCLYNETVEILRKYLKSDEFKHCYEEEKQIDTLYKTNQRNSFPKCVNIKGLGQCPLQPKEYCKERGIYENN